MDAFTMWNVFTEVLLLVSLFVDVVCQNQTSQSGNSTLTHGVGDDDNGVGAPKAVIAVALLTGAFLTGVLVAKLMEYYHVRHSIRDDASDISEYTRDILKAQLAMFKKGAKPPKLNSKESALRYGKLWRAKTAKNRALKMKGNKGKDFLDDPEAGVAVMGSTGKVVPATITEENEDENTSTDSNVTPVSQQKEEKNDSKDKEKSIASDESSKVVEESDSEEKVNFTHVKEAEQSDASGDTKISSSDSDKTKESQPQTLHYRGDSDDLMIPVRVSSDQGVKNKDAVPPGGDRPHSASSKSEYEFLSAGKSESSSGGDSEFSGQLTRETPHSVSAVHLEHKLSKGKGTGSTTPASSRDTSDMASKATKQTGKKVPPSRTTSNSTKSTPSRNTSNATTSRNTSNASKSSQGVKSNPSSNKVSPANTDTSLSKNPGLPPRGQSPKRPLSGRVISTKNK